MAKMSFKKMSLSDLVALRDQVQAAIAGRVNGERASLQRQLEALSTLASGGGGTVAPKRRGRPPGVTAAKASPRTGRKVDPKYRGPGGELWTGRGNTPRWLVALEGEGKKRDRFLIG